MEKISTEEEQKSIFSSRPNTDELTDANSKETNNFEPLHGWVQLNKETIKTGSDEKEQKSVFPLRPNTDGFIDANGKEKNYFEPLCGWIQSNEERTETEPSLNAYKSDDRQEKSTPLFSDANPTWKELSSHFTQAAPTESSKEDVVKDKVQNIDLKNMWQKISLMDQKNQKRQEERHENSDFGKQQNSDTKKLPLGDESNTSCLSTWECQEEKEYEAHFREWEKQFEMWKRQNKDHPDKDGFERYEKQWSEWRERLLRRREQVRTLRLQRQLFRRE